MDCAWTAHDNSEAERHEGLGSRQRTAAHVVSASRQSTPPRSLASSVEVHGPQDPTRQEIDVEFGPGRERHREESAAAPAVGEVVGRVLVLDARVMIQKADGNAHSAADVDPCSLGPACWLAAWRQQEFATCGPELTFRLRRGDHGPQLVRPSPRQRSLTQIERRHLASELVEGRSLTEAAVWSVGRRKSVSESRSPAKAVARRLLWRLQCLGLRRPSSYWRQPLLGTRRAVVSVTESVGKRF
eukprot:1256516-Rhodomonas_salina.3